MHCNFKDLTGQRFGKLVVIERADDYISPKGQHQRRWLCECDCGNVKKIHYTSLMNNIKSCGCHIKEINSKRCKSNKYGYKNRKVNTWIFEDNQVIGICHNKPDYRFIIDIEDYDKCKDYCWGYGSDGCITSRAGRLNRFIMNPPDNMVVDHINGNPLDNRRCNLRICTRQQNQMNHKLRSDNTSGCSGVMYLKKLNKWSARIQCNGIDYNLGLYVNKEDAIEARKQAEIKYFGEYRRR